MNARGFAMVTDGKIDVRSVHDTRRGVIVNWLKTGRDIVTTHWATDEAIEQKFEEVRGDARVVDVIIQVLQS